MEKIIKTGWILFCFMLILALSACSENNRTCSSCTSSFSESQAIYCPYCGEALPNHPDSDKDALDEISTQTDSDRIIGTWQHIDSSWGLMEYTFYSDGFCKGTYYGELTSYGYYNTVGGVNPSLYPGSYYDGSGDGYWYFVDNMLRIEYIGEEQGTMYHTYNFSADGMELTIEGKGKYSSSPGIAVWEKIS